MYADRSFASRSYADATDAAAGRHSTPSIGASVGPQVGGFAQAANAFRTFSDRSWAASGRAAGAVTPTTRTGANAQAAWAFRTWSDAAWAASGTEGGVIPPSPPPPPPPSTGAGSGKIDYEYHRNVGRRYEAPPRPELTDTERARRRAAVQHLGPARPDAAAAEAAVAALKAETAARAATAAIEAQARAAAAEQAAIDRAKAMGRQLSQAAQAEEDDIAAILLLTS